MRRHLADLVGGDVQTPRCQLSRELFWACLRGEHQGTEDFDDLGG